ncbi:uncharacterized protein LOC131684370 isoform X2 [Topomyia yanbarensis]|uniref:uncharacterized protein LOC131684370 isoform X2 n=1 Tax=Topomyia yanbarensis TaxID=2498891 RepID=UPI00273B5B63|nr:uncharacterized protein LOC131684370 isoform X2 [Topomyia yanbarensis]
MVNIKRSGSTGVTSSVHLCGEHHARWWSILNRETMKRRRLLAAVISVVLCSSLTSRLVLGSSLINSAWKQLMWETKDLLKLCATKNDSNWDCLRRESLLIVDNFVSSERIPLLTGAALVRVKDEHDKHVRPTDALARAVNESEPAVNNLNPETGGINVDGVVPVDKTWRGRVLRALENMFQTHVLQIDFLNAVDGKGQRNKKKEEGWLRLFYGKMKNQHVVEGRHRHRRQQMIPMMIFGVTVFGMFVIPMGFQFLAALSGKAFLMAKLALLLASINGLKRVRLP